MYSLVRLPSGLGHFSKLGFYKEMAFQELIITWETRLQVWGSGSSFH